MRLAVLVIITSLIAGSPLAARPTLDLRASPSVSTAPATVRIRITVPQDADNRSLSVVADSDEYSRSSAVPLDGADAPRTIFLEYRNLPPGTYEIRGSLVGAQGKQVAVAHSVVIVTGLGFD